MKMNNLFFPVFSFLLFGNFVWGQSCLPNGITLSSQLEINNFAVNYPGCTEIEGYLNIQETVSGSIKNLNGLIQLQKIGGNLSISNNTSLNNLQGLKNIQSIGKNLGIASCSSLKNFVGLEQLVSVGGNFSIGVNTVLTSFMGLEKLQTIGGDFSIEYNTTLTNVTGLEQLQSVEGDFNIFRTSIINMNGFDQLQSVGGFFVIQTNASLTSLEGMKQFQTVGRDLTIRTNASLINLAGLEQIRSIGQDLIIKGNAALTSLTGLAPMITFQPFSDLLIIENPNLSVCSEASICDFLKSGGPYEIRDNASGCNSKEEVIASCATSSTIAIEKDLFQIYPNPSTGKFLIRSMEPGLKNIKVVDFYGRLVLEADQMIDSELDLSGQASGIYFITIETDHTIITEKLIKL